MGLILLAVSVAVSNVVADLPSVVVEASRTDRSPMDLACPVQVISAREVVASGARDVTDLLARQCPQLSVSSLCGANPAGRQVAFQGYGEYGFARTLVMVDGERLNPADLSAPNLARIDMGSVQKVEVLNGPQTVLHGDMASAGMINVITDSDDYDRHGHVEFRGGSWGTFGASAGYRGGLADEGVQYWANGGFDRSDGYRRNSRHELWNAGGGVKWNAANGSSVRVSSFYSRTDYFLPRALSWEQWRTDPRQSVQEGAVHPEERVDRFQQEAMGVNVTAYGVLDDVNALRLTFTGSQAKTHSELYGGGVGAAYDYVWASVMDYDAARLRLRPEWIAKGSVLGRESELVLGGLAGYDRVDARGRSPTYLYPHGGAAAQLFAASDDVLDRFTMAYFGEETLRLTDAMALSFGLRYERVWNRCTQAEVQRSEANLWAGDLALNFTPSEDFKAFVRLTRFFRNASLDELSSRGGDRPLEAPDPELGWRGDVGMAYRFLDEFSVSADAYLSRTEKEIFYDPFFVRGPGVATGDNVNSPNPVRRFGMDGSVRWEREKLAALEFQAGSVHAVFQGGEYDGNEVPFVPALQLSAGGRLWLRDDFSILAGARYRARTYMVSDFGNDYDRLPSFTLFHVGCAYEPEFAEWVRGARIALTVDNLFDREYCDYATYGTQYYPACGRSFMLSVRYAF